MNKIFYYLYLIVVLFFSCLYIMTVGRHGGTAKQEVDKFRLKAYDAVRNFNPLRQDRDKFRLKAFEATIKVDPSVCRKDDEYCLKHTRFYRSLVCIDEVCNSTDKSIRSVDCAPAFAALYTPELQDKISDALCTLMKYPNPANRQAYLSLVVNETEGEAVELGGYLMALKGSAAQCEQYIKQYVGPWGPTWNFQWYRALSGCRILARERTLEEEEKDLNKWLEVTQGAGQCSQIVHDDMQEACGAPGATSPAPVYELLW